MIRSALLALTTLALAACGSGQSGSDGAAVAVTLYGEIAETNRGPIDGATEPLFAAYGIGFENGRTFTRAELAALDQEAIEVIYPLGSDARRFTGPRLTDVLAAAGATGERITVTALDGYQRSVELSRIDDHGVLLAIAMDGEPLGIGGYGPAMLVWPRDTDAGLAGQDDSDWVWGVFAIRSHDR